MVPRLLKVEGARGVGTEQSGDCARVAALLFDSAQRPDAAILAALSQQDGAFTIAQDTDGGTGPVELLRDGLTFDLAGLAPSCAITEGRPLHHVGLPNDFSVDGKAAIQLAPGPHLAGAEHLLPVVRVTAALVAALARLPGVCAIVWEPARLAMSPTWFVEAVRVWMAGGPFPVLALTALTRTSDSFTSDGLKFLTGQDFILSGKGGRLSEEDARVAVRLTDWLVAHGRVDTAREVVLAGVGPVWIEPNGMDRLTAMRL